MPVPPIEDATEASREKAAEAIRVNPLVLPLPVDGIRVNELRLEPVECGGSTRPLACAEKDSWIAVEGRSGPALPSAPPPVKGRLATALLPSTFFGAAALSEASASCMLKPKRRGFTSPADSRFSTLSITLQVNQAP